MLAKNIVFVFFLCICVFAYSHPQEMSKQWLVEQHLSFVPNDIAVDADGKLWLAGNNKLAMQTQNSFKVFSLEGVKLNSPTLYISQHSGKLYIGGESGLFSWQKRLLKNIGSPKKITHIDEDNQGRIWVIAQGVLYFQELGKWRKFRSVEAKVRNIEIWQARKGALATDLGLWLLHKGKRHYFMELLARPGGLSDMDVRAVKVDAMGSLFIGTKKGLDIYDLKDGWISLTPKKGYPLKNITSLDLSKDGTLWAGSNNGITRFYQGKWEYFNSRRWLPDNHVRKVVALKEGDAYILTKTGVAKLYQQSMSLKQKADIYNDRIIKRHKRFGFVMDRHLKNAYDFNSGKVRISDNDGLWTGLYIASQAFRHSVLKKSNKEEAKQALKEACESLDALIFLHEVTGIKGFPARAVRHASEPEYGRPHHRNEWHKSKDKKWEWKGETSSDEISGHYFALYTAFEHFPSLREKVKKTTVDMTNHILKNNYSIIDKDGRPTTWGVWDPESLNHEEMWFWERGLNSLQILSFLKVAYHIAKDERYNKEYLKLIRKHRYALNSIEQKIVDPYQVYHDTQLAYLGYYTLLSLEKNPAIRRTILMSLERTFRLVEKERCPLWNFITCCFIKRPSSIYAGITTLEEIPMDLRKWGMHNSHRRDIKRQPKSKWKKEDLAAVPLPFTQRPLRRWDGNPFRLDSHGNGKRENEPTIFLLPYWMGRYHGFIAEKQ